MRTKISQVIMRGNNDVEVNTSKIERLIQTERFDLNNKQRKIMKGGIQGQSQ